jgi:hypothetical protein
MKKEYYKIYGETTGKIAGAVYLEEKKVEEICNQLNDAEITKEKLNYAGIGPVFYGQLKRRLERKILESQK